MSIDLKGDIHSRPDNLSVHPSKDSGLSIPTDPIKHRPWFEEA